jgi:hypothetical protein
MWELCLLDGFAGIRFFPLSKVFAIVRTMGKNRVSGVEAVWFGLKQLFGVVPAIVLHCASLCSIVLLQK